METSGSPSGGSHEEAAADELEIDAELGVGDAGDDRSVSVDDFLSALETALESVLGDEVEIDADELADDEVEADVEIDAEMDMGDEEIAAGPEEDLPLEERQKEGDCKESSEADDELVEQITKRVAARILKTALANK